MFHMTHTENTSLNALEILPVEAGNNHSLTLTGAIYYCFFNTLADADIICPAYYINK